MLNGVGEALYVGKARNLAPGDSYTQPNRLSNRLMRMVSETESRGDRHQVRGRGAAS